MDGTVINVPAGVIQFPKRDSVTDVCAVNRTLASESAHTHLVPQLVNVSRLDGYRDKEEGCIVPVVPQLCKHNEL